MSDNTEQTVENSEGGYAPPVIIVRTPEEAARESLTTPASAIDRRLFRHDKDAVAVQEEAAAAQEEVLLTEALPIAISGEDYEQRLAQEANDFEAVITEDEEDTVEK